jgi:hypothetical protein
MSFEPLFRGERYFIPSVANMQDAQSHPFYAVRFRLRRF